MLQGPFTQKINSNPKKLAKQCFGNSPQGLTNEKEILHANRQASAKQRVNIQLLFSLRSRVASPASPPRYSQNLEVPLSDLQTFMLTLAPIGPFRAEAMSASVPNTRLPNPVDFNSIHIRLRSWRIQFREATGPAELSLVWRTQVRTWTVIMMQGAQARQPPRWLLALHSGNIHS